MPEQRKTSTPLYEQIRLWVLDLIADGSYGPGDRLPSESALADQFQIHRLTARRALEELAREGVVVARKGSGTYVAPQRTPLPVWIPLNREGFGPSLRRQSEGLTSDAAGVPLLYLRRHGRADRVRYVVEYDNSAG